MKVIHIGRSRAVGVVVPIGRSRAVGAVVPIAPTVDLRLLGLAVACCCACLILLGPVTAHAAVAPIAKSAGSQTAATGGSAAGGSPAEGSSLEAAASKAGSTGRKVAMSLIGLAFAIAGIVLAFRRDFREAAGVFAVGIVAVLLATPAGINLLQDTVNSLFGS
jgi:hypothetical protein